MGLDNGLIIRSKTPRGKHFISNFYNNYKDKYHNFNSDGEELELLYWRKCWNIRGEIIGYFKFREVDEGTFILKIEDLLKFNNILYYFIVDPDNWKDNGGSIWDWDEMLPLLAQQMGLVGYFITNITDNSITDEDIEIEFYDSY